MTLQDFFNAISANPAILIVLLLAVPLATLVVNMWSGSTAEQVLKWKYVYAALAYLACVPGIFALTLNVYLFLFERQSIWTMNLGTQALPIVTMVATLMLIKRQIPFDFVPAFGKLSGFMTLITATMSIMWFIDRTRIYAITYVPFSYIAIGFLIILIAIRFAWSKIF